MWYYKKLGSIGYIRSLAIADSKRYIFDILSSNRTILHKIYQRTLCVLFGHNKGKICIQKGYSKEKGFFELCLCDVCRCRVLFYDGEVK